MRLNDSEWSIMTVIWDHGPCTARQVHERLEGATGWATTTVRTLLARLVEKGVLAERRREGIAVFEAQVTREGARTSALRSLVERAFDGTFGSLVQHMLQKERLSRGDRERLRRMLEEADGTAKSDADASRAANGASNRAANRAAGRAASRRGRRT